MRTTFLGDTGVATSVIGFGCADLFRQPSRVGRQRLLEAALDAGIRHFDVAPMYGLGLGESELGRFARDRRGQIVLATKFGIRPTPAARMLGRVQAPLQRLLNASSAFRQRARPGETDPRTGAVGSVLYTDGGYDGAAARASLERSLRKLGTDHVDLLSLHDPKPGDVRSDDVCAYLESARASGMLRAWGVAGEAGPIFEVARILGSRGRILQFRRDIFSPALQSPPLKRGQATILFGVIGRALRRIVAHTNSDGTVGRRWDEAVGANCRQSGVIASLLLRDALQANAEGPVLFSTIHPERIGAAVQAAEASTSSDAQLVAFRTLVAEELTSREDRL